MNRVAPPSYAEPDSSAPAVPAAQETQVVSSAELFGGGKEVIIDHQGERYRLRHTSKGKLILTK